MQTPSVAFPHFEICPLNSSAAAWHHSHQDHCLPNILFRYKLCWNPTNTVCLLQVSRREMLCEEHKRRTRGQGSQTLGEKLRTIPLRHFSFASLQWRQMEKDSETNHSPNMNLQRGVLERPSSGASDTMSEYSSQCFCRTNPQREELESRRRQPWSDNLIPPPFISLAGPFWQSGRPSCSWKVTG